MLTWLKGKKTYLTAAAGIVAAIAALASGEMALKEATEAIVACLLVAFTRAGVAKVERKV